MSDNDPMRRHYTQPRTRAVHDGHDLAVELEANGHAHHGVYVDTGHDGDPFHVDAIRPDGRLVSDDLTRYVAVAEALRTAVDEARGILEAAGRLTPAGRQALARIEELEAAADLAARR